MTYAETTSHWHYVTVRDDGDRFGLLVGPFRSHRAALKWVEPARKAAREVNDRAHWYSYGTSRVTSKTRPKDGLLNERLEVTV